MMANKHNNRMYKYRYLSYVREKHKKAYRESKKAKMKDKNII